MPATLHPLDPARPLIGADEAASILGLTVRTVRRLIAEGDLPVRRIGGSVKIHPADLDRVGLPDGAEVAPATPDEFVAALAARRAAEDARRQVAQR